MEGRSDCSKNQDWRQPSFAWNKRQQALACQRSAARKMPPIPKISPCGSMGQFSVTSNIERDLNIPRKMGVVGRTRPFHASSCSQNHAKSKPGRWAARYSSQSRARVTAGRRSSRSTRHQSATGRSPSGTGGGAGNNSYSRSSSVRAGESGQVSPAVHARPSNAPTVPFTRPSEVAIAFSLIPAHISTIVHLVSGASAVVPLASRHPRSKRGSP